MGAIAAVPNHRARDAAITGAVASGTLTSTVTYLGFEGASLRTRYGAAVAAGIGGAAIGAGIASIYGRFRDGEDPSGIGARAFEGAAAGSIGAGATLGFLGYEVGSTVAHYTGGPVFKAGVKSGAVGLGIGAIGGALIGASIGALWGSRDGERLAPGTSVDV
jgi:hypothetical protein